MSTNKNTMARAQKMLDLGSCLKSQARKGAPESRAVKNCAKLAKEAA